MRAYCDGACRCGNPGETSAAWAIFDDDQVVAQFSTYLGPQLHTNNYAEYQGMLMLLRWAHENSVEGLDIYCDSKLVVKQVSGEWSVNSEDLKPLYLEAYTLRVIGKHTLHHVRGHNGDPGNEYVDSLCNLELDKAGF